MCIRDRGHYDLAFRQAVFPMKMMANQLVVCVPKRSRLEPELNCTSHRLCDIYAHLSPAEEEEEEEYLRLLFKQLEKYE